VRPPRRISPAARRRRELLVDVALGLVLAIVAIVVAAGIGVVGFFALLCALALVPWYLVEGWSRRSRRLKRRSAPHGTDR
jgi:NhaP-type Na+/H+ or K+/H+ antiporter